MAKNAKINRLPIDVIAIEKHYLIGKNGSILTIRRGRYLKPVLNSAGYLHVCLHLYIPNKFFLVHRLVAAKYLGQCPAGMEACHESGNKLNNNASNIIYKTHSANIIQSYKEHGHSRWLERKHQKLNNLQTPVN
jgi:hypothetical protein